MANSSKVCTLIWLIENYSYCWQVKGESFVSPVFTASEMEGTSWTLRLYPRGEYYKPYHVSISLDRNDSNEPYSLRISFHISLVTSNGTIVFSTEGSTYLEKGKTLNFTNFLSRNAAVCLEKNVISSEIGNACSSKDFLKVCCKLWNVEGKADTVLPPICARTRIGIEHISFLHAVESFSLLEKNIKKTVQIPSPSKKGSIISSSLYWTTRQSSTEEVILHILPSDSNKILAKCEISVIEASGKITKWAEESSRLYDAGCKISELVLSVSKGNIVINKDRYLPEDKLSLLCDCVFSTGIEFQKIEEGQNEMITTSIKYSSDYPHIKETYREKMSVCPNVLEVLDDIYRNKFLTDVVLKTETNSFPAHKVVLCARSPYFKVMMNTDMKEKNSGSISVDDLEDNTVEQLLLFLYTDNLEDLQWESAIKLYYATDRYQIEKLRLICSSFLIDNLTTSTATELLLLADAHSDSDLKKVVEDFILEHDEQVFGSAEWEELVKGNPQLALKTMHLKYKGKKEENSTDARPSATEKKPENESSSSEPNYKEGSTFTFCFGVARD